MSLRRESLIENCLFLFRRCSSRNSETLKTSSTIGKWYSVNNRSFVENEAVLIMFVSLLLLYISPQPAKTFWKWTSFLRNSTLKSSKNNCLTRWVIITGSSVKSNAGPVGSKSNEHCGINNELLDVIRTTESSCFGPQLFTVNPARLSEHEQLLIFWRFDVRLISLCFCHYAKRSQRSFLESW